MTNDDDEAQEAREDKRRKLLAQMSDLDQTATFMADHLAILWWGIYTNLQKQGFTDSQAMDLLKVYITRP